MPLIKQIESIAKDQKLVSVLSQLEEIKTLYREHDFLDIVILGQFKAGKSSFINSLIKNNSLPVGVLPVTAIVTRISYGIEPKAVVSHFDDSKEEITLEHLSEFISEKLNPKNYKEVKVVDIFLPEIKPFIPIRLVDTPGLGSIFSHNTDVTHKWLGKIKAAIVVISAAQPLSEDDLKLIRQATNQSPEVYILVSKADMVSSKELPEIIAFIRIKLNEEYHKDFRIFPYSINNNTTRLRTTIIDDVIIPLAKSSDLVQQQVYKHKLNYLAKKTIGYLEISLSMIKQKGEDRKKLKLKIIDETLNLKYIKQELFQIGNNYKTVTRDFLKKLFLDKQTEQLVKELSGDLALQFDTWKGNLAKVTQQYEKWIRESMVKTIKQVELNEWDTIASHPEEACNHFNSYLKNFRERVNQNIKKTLNINMPMGEVKIKASPLQSPPIHISRTFDSHIDMLWFIVPMPLFRKTLKKHFLNEIPHEIEKNSYRLISQLNDVVNNIIDEMQIYTLEYVERELKSLATTIENQQWNREEIQSMISQLSKIIY